jgi:hypothetical protein
LDLATCGANLNTSLKKKNPSSSLKTYLLGLETGSRIFGTMISAKKNGENAKLNNFKSTWKNFRCSDFTVHFLRYKIIGAAKNFFKTAPSDLKLTKHVIKSQIHLVKQEL